MKKIYIYDDYLLSSSNGVGTFLKEFVGCVTQYTDIHVCMIMFCTNAEEFRIGMRGNLEYFFFPKELCPDPFKECEPIGALLEQYISDSEDTFFLFNYIPCVNLVYETRKHFPLSKQISVVHDFNWTSILWGNVDLFRRIISQKEKKASVQLTEVESIVNKLHQEEMEQYRAVDQVICLSEDTFHVLEECYWVPKEKIALIPHGMDAVKKSYSETTKRKWKQFFYMGVDEKIILIAGRVNRMKGTFAYLDAFKKVLKQNANCRLVIAGSLNNAPDLLADAGEAITKITLTGQLKKKDLSRWYKIADIGILPSYSEQCSYVGLEMMSHGLPVIASDAFGVRCMFQDSVNAYIAPIGNRKKSDKFVDKLVECTLDLLNNPVEQKKLRNNARRILKEKYNFLDMKEHYKAVFMV